MVVIGRNKIQILSAVVTGHNRILAVLDKVLGALDRVPIILDKILDLVQRAELFHHTIEGLTTIAEVPFRLLWLWLSRRSLPHVWLFKNHLFVLN